MNWWRLRRCHLSINSWGGFLWIDFSRPKYQAERRTLPGATCDLLYSSSSLSLFFSAFLLSSVWIIGTGCLPFLHLHCCFSATLQRPPLVVYEKCTKNVDFSSENEVTFPLLVVLPLFSSILFYGSRRSSRELSFFFCLSLFLFSFFFFCHESLLWGNLD